MRAVRRNRAFTLVEILIVVVILGILAAIVVPQFTNASTEAQTSNVESQLQTIRNQVELFRAQNNGTYPADLIAGGDETCWDTLIAGDFLRAAPYNPRTSAADVGTQTTANNGAAILAARAVVAGGWVWDDGVNSIYAVGFNEGFRYSGENPWAPF